MTTEMHYDQLRDRRVTSKDQLVIGRTYLICHVPMDNPYTRGVDPDVSTKKIIDLQFLSSNDIEMGQKGLWKNSPEIKARMLADETLSKKAWMFRTEEEDFEPGRPYINWHHVSTYIDGTWGTMNYVLDPVALAEEGITVLETTSVPYVISEELLQEREWESDLERSYYAEKLYS